MKSGQGHRFWRAGRIIALLVVWVALGTDQLLAQPPPPTWSKVFDSSRQTFDVHATLAHGPGFVLVGSRIRSLGASQFGWIVQLNPTGGIMEQKIHLAGGVLNAVTRTTDGYAAAGYTYSYGAGGKDFWVVYRNQDLTHRWQRAYGGPGTDVATAVVELDGKLIVVGHTNSFGAGDYDFWILRLDPADGNLIHQGTIGLPGSDELPHAVLPLAFTGYNTSFVVAGESDSAFGAGDKDAYVVRFQYTIQQRLTSDWEFFYGGDRDDLAYALSPSGSGIVVGGEERSFHGPLRTDSNMWLFKIDQWGTILWQNTYGGLKDDRARSITELQGGRLLVGGDTYSSLRPTRNFWVLNLDAVTGTWANGWSKVYDMDRDDTMNTVLEVPGGEYYLIAGDALVADPRAFRHWWVLKTDTLGVVNPNGDLWKCIGDLFYPPLVPTDELRTEIVGVVGGGGIASDVTATEFDTDDKAKELCWPSP